jgi:hypothetical protein
MSFPLSAAGTTTFTVNPVVGSQQASDGRPLYVKWQTLIAAVDEADGIRWRGIVTEIDPTGDTLTLTVDSIATYPHGIPFEGEYYGAFVDPGDLVAMIWGHVQSYSSPSGDLGVVVTGETGKTLGTDSTAKLQQATLAFQQAYAVYKAAKADLTQAKTRESNSRQTMTSLVRQRTAASQQLTAAKKANEHVADAQAAYDAIVADIKDISAVVAEQKLQTGEATTTANEANATAVVANTAMSKASDQEQADGGAWELLWWNTPDCGDTIDTLASDNLFDWYETHAWNADKSDIVTTINVAYPRAGRKRTDLPFEEGVNVTVQPQLTDKGDEYANEVFGIGAGEGAGAPRTSTAVNDGGLRRVSVYTTKSTKSPATLAARTRKVLTQKQQTLTISSITVRDHPDCRIGSWITGDDILVRTHSQTLGEQAIWFRVTSWTLTSETTADLSLARSDSFNYGG